MSPFESALIGFSLIGCGIGLFAWGVVRRRAWERGEVAGPAAPSFSWSPAAPGRWRISFGIALVFVGVLVLAPFVASL